VARYRIDEDEAAVSIELTEQAGEQEELLEAFRECQEGRCTCPTEEYRKVASMDVDADEDRIAIRLESKPGERLDSSEIMPAWTTPWARSRIPLKPRAERADSYAKGGAAQYGRLHTACRLGSSSRGLPNRISASPGGGLRPTRT
jgi:hypothetical protein